MRSHITALAFMVASTQVAQPSATCAQGPARAQSGLVYGSVVASDSAQTAVPGADLVLQELNRRERSDSLGNFSFDRVPPGSYTLVVRHWGFGSQTMPLSVKPGDTVVSTVTLDAIVPVLEAVKVLGTRRPDPRFADELESARKTGFGYFMDRDALEKEPPGHPLALALAARPGIVIKSLPELFPMYNFHGSQGFVPGKFDAVAVSARDLRCKLSVYVDGVRQSTSGGLFDLNAFTVDDIEAVAIYSGAADAPSRYATLGNPCGVLVLWTRAPGGR